MPEKYHKHQPIWLTSTKGNPISADVLVLTDLIYEDSKDFEKIILAFDSNYVCANEIPVLLEKYKDHENEVTYWQQQLDSSWKKIDCFP